MLCEQTKIGNYSQLLLVEGDADICTIDWAACESAAAQLYLSDPKPKTLYDLINLWDGQKFVGYLMPEDLRAIQEVARHTTAPHPMRVAAFFKDEELLFMRFVFHITPKGGHVNSSICDLCLETLPFEPLRFEPLFASTEEDSQ